MVLDIEENFEILRIIFFNQKFVKIVNFCRKNIEKIEKMIKKMHKNHTITHNACQPCPAPVVRARLLPRPRPPSCISLRCACRPGQSQVLLVQDI